MNKYAHGEIENIPSSLKYVEIIANSKGKPLINLNKKSLSYLKKKFKVNSFKTNLSLSDEKNYSIAYVVIEKI